MQPLKSPIAWGLAGVALTMAIGLILGGIYVASPWQRTVVFYTSDAASIRQGDQVRMAGITVGSVKELSIEPNQVRVVARVDRSAFVGDRSQVDVRMLTVVGGYSVNIESVGDAPLGDAPIPQDRVTMPYNLMSALTATTKITDNLNPQPINQSLNEFQSGLEGPNVESLSAIINAGNSLMSIFEKQRGQVSAILNMSDEYIEALSGYREQLVQLVGKVSIVIQTIELYNKGFGGALDGLGEAVMALKTLGDFYQGHRIEFIEKVREYQHRFRLFVERNGLTVRALKRVQNLFNRILDAQNARPALLATDLCIPVPGRGC
jgi:phospholipid/cholesterol/gamma-HCH transport system substrate-binding protein